jgi:hypothetical protein
MFRYISRFNEEGRKTKSKGNHVWSVEAKKLSSGHWEFKEFVRRIIGPIPSPISVGNRFEYKPRVWDPQLRSPKVVFHSPWLPDWLHWEGNTLTGIPNETSTSCEVKIIASYFHGDVVYKLEKVIYIHVTSAESVDLPMVSYMYIYIYKDDIIMMTFY